MSSSKPHPPEKVEVAFRDQTLQTMQQWRIAFSIRLYYNLKSVRIPSCCYSCLEEGYNKGLETLDGRTVILEDSTKCIRLVGDSKNVFSCSKQHMVRSKGCARERKVAMLCRTRVRDS